MLCVSSINLTIVLRTNRDTTEKVLPFDGSMEFVKLLTAAVQRAGRSVVVKIVQLFAWVYPLSFKNCKVIVVSPSSAASSELFKEIVIASKRIVRNIYTSRSATEDVRHRDGLSIGEETGSLDKSSVGRSGGSVFPVNKRKRQKTCGNSWTIVLHQGACELKD